ncbi:hypothetical protein EVAR_86977_1 [Eumeta japonica]|uniref:Uncharacterized protein n=1 Tax=Eumeta variegata TaxID=151549 RepID=A0A4C1W9B1_EUMVA|nr:hypothetical protein EVAR_86977_1 [Eumeta japonica]
MSNSLPESLKTASHRPPVGGTTSDSDSSDISDHSEFTVRRKASKASERNLSIIPHAGLRWVYPTTALTRAVEAENPKRQPRGRENSISDEADVTAPTPQRGSKPPPMFVQNKDRWTELRKMQTKHSNFAST